MRKKTKTSDQWAQIFATLRDWASRTPHPSLNVLHDSGSTPWQILVATIISLRTRDAVTLEVSQRLFLKAPGAKELLGLPPDQLEALLYPSAFYRRKAVQLRSLAGLLSPPEYAVPKTANELLKLPGVGHKTANLVLNLAFGIDAICVDTHVHRIANRMGWIKTATPDESEAALEKILPQRYWIETNSLLVAFGQSQCTPVSPRCSTCPFCEDCPKMGVKTHR